MITPPVPPVSSTPSRAEIPTASTPAGPSLAAIHRLPSCPAPAAALLLDEHDLAVRARTTLAAADHAVVVNTDREVVALHDQDGEPVVAEPSGALRTLADRGRRVSLVIAPRVDDGVWLVLDGVLHSDGLALRLGVESVWVGCPHGHGHARPLALDAYAQAAPDLLAAAVPRVIEHGNGAHAVHLRELAERRLGLAAGMVAAASITALDGDGLTLNVVDAVGARELRLPFVSTAVDVPSLMSQLRQAVTS